MDYLTFSAGQTTSRLLLVNSVMEFFTDTNGCHSPFLWTDPRPRVLIVDFLVYNSYCRSPLSHLLVCQWSRAWARHSACTGGRQRTPCRSHSRLLPCGSFLSAELRLSSLAVGSFACWAILLAPVHTSTEEKKGSTVQHFSFCLKY